MSGHNHVLHCAVRGEVMWGGVAWRADQLVESFDMFTESHRISWEEELGWLVDVEQWSGSRGKLLHMG